jgi:hypothetical protein
MASGHPSFHNAILPPFSSLSHCVKLSLRARGSTTKNGTCNVCKRLHYIYTLFGTKLVHAHMQGAGGDVSIFVAAFLAADIVRKPTVHYAAGNESGREALNL